MVQKLIEHAFELIIAGVVVIFCLAFFLNVEIDGKKGVFQIVGSLYTEDDDINSNSASMIQAIQGTPAPEITYIGGVRHVGQTISLKENISVYLPSENATYTGAEEGNFKITVIDVRDSSGNSMISEIDSDLAEESEEIITALSYDFDTDKLIFYESGTYDFYINVYGQNGRVARHVITIPVEVS